MNDELLYGYDTADAATLDARILDDPAFARELVAVCRQEVHLRDLLRRRRSRAWIAVAASILVALATAVVLFRGQPDRPVPASMQEDEVRKWVDKLGSTDPSVRDAADQKLRTLGEGDLKVLEKLRDDAKDPEIRARLDGIVEHIRKRTLYDPHDDTKITWSSRTGYIAPTGPLQREIRVEGDTATIRSVRTRDGGSELDRRIRLKPDRLRELLGLLKTADFLNLEYREPGGAPPPGNGPWEFGFQPRGGKMKRIRSRNGMRLPGELRAVDRFFEDLVGTPDEFARVKAGPDTKPLALPTVKVHGAEPGVFKGTVTWIGAGQVQLGRIMISWSAPAITRLDLKKGTEIEVIYRSRQGFEGTATGLVLRDGKGPILILDDGDYGSALSEEDVAPFQLTLEDAGYRNRRNTPGDLNNFRLVVKKGGDSVKLIHGQRADLGDHTVLAVRALSVVDGKKWTDAPYTYKSFVIWRK